MLAFTLRRIAVSIPVLLASTLLMSVIVRLSGDPLAPLINRQPPVAPAQIEAQRHALHLDQNFIHRWITWLSGVVHGNFGYSNDSKDIGSVLSHSVWVTTRLVLGAMILAFVLALISGTISASRQYSKLDNGLTLFGFLCLSLPVPWFAALLKLFLAIKVNDLFHHDFVDTIGESTPGLQAGWWGHLKDDASHLVLPTIALALVSFASWSRYLRASMLEVQSSDYVRLARAKGLSNSRVLIRHSLRTALIPFTTIVAIDIGAIIGGAVLTESVFGWHGMGETLIRAVHARDMNMLLGWLLITGIVVIAFNLIADILYATLDPRIRYA